MILKIGDKTFDSNEEPVLILFTRGEIKSIKESSADSDIFCSWPPSWDPKKGKDWHAENQKKLIEIVNSQYGAVQRGQEDIKKSGLTLVN